MFAQESILIGDASALNLSHSAKLPKYIYPQIVRLSLVEGDVRVAVGKQKGGSDAAPWEKAAANTPLESGFSVVTGDGRAEIEFEDASTMYLAPNSVLRFDELSTKDGVVPRTEMSLLTGTATLHLQPRIPGEIYLLDTPTYFIAAPFGSIADLRVSSYLNGITLVPLEHTSLHFNGVRPRVAEAGSTVALTKTTVVPCSGRTGDCSVLPARFSIKKDNGTPDSFSAWDKWVANRVAARDRAMQAVMQQAGLSEPLPGLEDMQSRGKFFACAPYGTCWEPTKGWSGHLAAPPQQVNDAGQPVSGTQASPGAAAGQAQTSTPAQQTKLEEQAERDEEQAEEQTAPGGFGPGEAVPAVWVEDDFFPCSPYASLDLMTLDPMTGDEVLLASDVVWNGDGFGWYGYGFGYDWAVCHAGSWIYRQHRYVWVAGTRRHHRHPVRWVTVNGKLGYVPVHPRDETGKTPRNLRHGIFVTTDRKGGQVERIAYDPHASVKLLAEAPKGFQMPLLPHLHAAEAPTAEARLLMEPVRGVKLSEAILPVSKITFDRKSQGFTLVTQVNNGSRSRTFVDHFGGGGQRGGGAMLQASGGGGRGGYSSGSGRSYGGGGGRSYSGGGSWSGGGGVRSSGGSSFASSNSSSSSSAGASSSGGHSH